MGSTWPKLDQSDYLCLEIVIRVERLLLKALEMQHTHSGNKHKHFPLCRWKNRESKICKDRGDGSRCSRKSWVSDGLIVQLLVPSEIKLCQLTIEKIKHNSASTDEFLLFQSTGKHWRRVLEKKVEFLEKYRGAVENSDFVAFL